MKLLTKDQNDDSPATPNEVVWAAVYAEYLPRVYNYFHYWVNDPMAAEDLTATVFEKAWRNRQRYQANLGAFSTWLFTLARNVARDYFRQPQREAPWEESPEHTTQDPIEEVLARRETHARLRVLLNRLAPREQELITLKYGAGLTNREIARLTRYSETNVGTILHRVVEQLRKQWEDHDGR
ncbi:MAG TPA: sigma-70 family RNA polymerase sigma factor [Anaerolineae bacterium]|nr:sigma-70 family RNA polymerase sigma factor [Anaerolineae bacterium]HQI86161.1 sigma-70 family RNA polymerase sigma factor [Anaerolineae bacterium]